MHTPSPKYFCPRCRAAFDVDSNYCGRCGADMHRASRLQRALMMDEESGPRARGLAATEAPPPGRAAPLAAGSGPERAAQPEPSYAERAPRDRRVSLAHDPWLGRVVDNRYRVIDIIGRGGMGVVYKVEHQRMGKIAAMKVLHRDLAGDREVIGRFQREAEAVSRLTHPNTVQVFDFGTAQGALYLVMEYVRGLDLGSLIDRDGPMRFERAAPLFLQICAALGEAHEFGVVHRDLKPENILVTRTHGGQDFIKVLDFGLAKLAEREEVAAVTSRGSIVGTPYFMSPEQIRGEEEVDARSDIYSLGALMYRVLTGHHAFTASTPVGVLTKHLTEPLVLPSRRAPELHLPLEVDDLVLKAMRKQRGERYQTVGELAADLEALCAELYEHTASGRRPLLPRSASHTPRELHADIDYGIDSERRLNRADLDAFERSLVRRRRIRLVAIPLLIAAAAGAAYYALVWRARQPRTAEVERNDDVDQATPIASGTKVTGTLGKRISRTKGDRDHFRLVETPAPGGGDLLSIDLGGIPNMDLVLSVYEPGGALIAQRDEGGVGAPEQLRNLRVRRPVVIGVAEAPTATGMPTENVSDSYVLVARLAPAAPGIESEPNDAASDAGALRPGVAVEGWLDRREDVDRFSFDGAAGRYRVRIAGAAEVPLTWRVEGVAQAGREATVDLAPGDVVELARSDRDGAKAGALPGAGEAYRIEVEPAL